jgi:hypothetical protein
LIADEETRGMEVNIWLAAATGMTARWFFSSF